MKIRISDQIVICAVRDVQHIFDRGNVGAVISIETAVPNFARPKPWHAPRLNIPQLVLTIEDGGYNLTSNVPAHLVHPPHLNHIKQALSFAHLCDPTKTLLIHCRFGLARSAAIALAIVAQDYGLNREMEAVKKLKSIRPRALPSLPITELADLALGRKGALLEKTKENNSIEYAVAEVFMRQKNKHPMLWPAARVVGRALLLGDFSRETLSSLTIRPSTFPDLRR